MVIYVVRKLLDSINVDTQPPKELETRNGIMRPLKVASGVVGAIYSASGLSNISLNLSIIGLMLRLYLKYNSYINFSSLIFF